ncbi:hypothetical protein [Rugosimonospora africana]|uniref:Uncharacterized protein n=1 Tax=Rugosimonospora africana TaxID=556532 RepID=A0A8J3VSJ7_9ACTN|nr:hypothetical protein [Rugosimonospora africana]GIH16676.1 hypothetical protein Raf01_48480 [Rugosimonospora africana]
MTSDLSGYDIHYYPTGATDISSGAVAPWMLSLENTINGNDPGNKPMYVEEVGWKYGWDSTNDAQPHVSDYTYGLNMAAMGIQLACDGASAPMASRLADLGSPKVWGMYDGAGGDTSLRPWSYSWTMLTQAFPKDATLYKPTQPTSVFTMLGSIGSGSSRHWSIAVANLTSNTSTQTFTLPNSAGRTLHAYRYVDGTRATNSDGFPASTDTVTAASNGDVTVSVAADSMLLLSDIDG